MTQRLPQRCAGAFVARGLGCVIVLSGCDGPQSALAPRSDDAMSFALLGNIMFVGAGVIFVAVLFLVALAVMAPHTIPQKLRGNTLIVAGGLIFPVVLLTALLTYGLVLTRYNSQVTGEEQIRIEVTGEQFWWRVLYFTPSGAVAFETANEIYIPAGVDVALVLKSADVIHSFWVPSLGGKVDMTPGRTTLLQLSAREAGTYRGQCSEYCGAQHANMSFHVIAVSAEEYAGWLQRQVRPATDPADAFLAEGRALFHAHGCGNCHVIRGSEAGGKFGPDLTHVGSRQFIGAGMYPMNAGTLAGWIAGSQHLKPGNRMPSFETLSGRELRAIADYLESLK